MSDRSWIPDCLRTVPAGDVNFKSALERATDRQLRGALEHLKARPKNNRSRITAILREQRRRQRKEETYPCS